MKKLIVQIPCYNEAETIAQTIRDIPRDIAGVDRVEVLVIDDGSSDETAAAAKVAGADHILRNGANKGLAQTFQRGLDEALRLGADIIVNTDGDNQYRGADIALLVAPIIAGEADIVVGDRRTGEIAHFSPLKKALQKIGSRAVSRLANAEIADAVSGFRAFSREAAFGVTVRSSFSYTTETLIQAGRKNLIIKSVPIRTNSVTRPSRLFRSIPQFLSRTGRTMLRAYAMYEPLKIFMMLGAFLMMLGAIPIVRFLIYYFLADGGGKIQSLLLGGVLVVMGVLCAMFALIADLIAYNRKLLEMTLERVRRLEYGRGAVDGADEKESDGGLRGAPALQAALEKLVAKR
ncbi:MAG: glycosyltransferase family 2 protein [Pseudomonadota bacterium]